MDEETVIGFDAREMQVAYTTSWPPDRRERFLLTEALIKPLSIDIFVWPSLFAPSVTVVGGTDQINFYESDLQIPLQHRSLDNLWRDLGAMHQYLAAALQNRQVRYWEIAITEVMSSSDPEELIVHDVFVPSKVNSEWTLLGYDVSDSGFRSALTGAAYEKYEISNLRERWTPYLNEYHLFTERQYAEEFAHWADNRDVGHAPNAVNGLYLIRQIDNQ